MARRARADATPSPFVSFVVPVASTHPARTPAVLASIAAQTSIDHEVIVVRPTASQTPSATHGRGLEIRVPDTSTLAEAINHGLEAAHGRFVAFLAPGDTLAPHAVSALKAAVTPETDVVYTDEIVEGRVFAKPRFSPERLRCQPYLGHLTLFRREHLRAIGGARSGIDGAEDYDLALRGTRGAHVDHVAEALLVRGSESLSSGWGTTSNDTRGSVARVLQDHLDATGGGTIDGLTGSGLNRTRRPATGHPLVSIVIPTRGTSASVRGRERCMVVEAVRGIVERSTYANIEFVIVLDSVASSSVRDDLRRLGGGRLSLVEWTRPFSFSEKVNLGVAHARGEFVLLLNDDIEVISPDWIEAMLALAQRPKAGLVGAMLYFEDDTIQHAGHAYYALGVTHIGLHSERGAAGPWGAFLVEREVAGVTCACALVRASTFVEAGGLSTLLPRNFNDVDLCMKLAALGYQSYWTPHAELYHYESRSRDPRVYRSEVDTTWRRWGDQFRRQPFWPTGPDEVFSREGSA